MDVAPMIINDRTLVPARFVAEAFACKVEWDADNYTVNITSSNIDYSKMEKSSETASSKNEEQNNSINLTAKGTIGNPYSASDGAVITYHEWSHYPQKQVAIKCVNVIRGTSADNLAYSENMFNDKPNSSQEWCFLEFDVKYISSAGSGEEVLEGSDVIYDDTFFDINGAKLNVADIATLGDKYGGYGIFETEFYPGSSGKVVIGILINKNVGDILLRVPNKTTKTNTWIKCTDYSSSGSTSTSVSHSQSESLNSNSVSPSSYPGTSIPTYTSVTGVELKAQDTLDNGAPLYRYRYTDADDVGDYWEKLSSNGWTLYKGDDKSTTNKFESCFVKDSQMIILNVYLDFVEVWITY